LTKATDPCREEAIENIRKWREELKALGTSEQGRGDAQG
jgi:hypothetical protein